MLVERDLEVLGLSGMPSEGDVRRAYLRQVKLHPPERDPDGFRTVREAYERLKGQLRVKQLIAGAIEPAAVVEPAPVVEPAAVVEPAPVVGPAPIGDAPAADEPEFVVEPDARRHPEVACEVDRLNRALERKDADGAAVAMTYLYRRPLIDEVPVPSPYLALETFMELIESGAVERARALLDAFDAYMSSSQIAYGGELAGRWRLSREVAAVCDFDRELGRVLAQGLRAGKLYRASAELESAQVTYGNELERFMKREAPTLWASVSHLLKPPRRALSFGSGFSFGSWPVRALWFLGFGLIRLCSSFGNYSYSAPEVSRLPPPSFEMQRSQADLREPPPAASVSDAVARQLSGSWATVDSAVANGDCQTVREQWPLYVAATRLVRVPDDVKKDHSGRVLAMCPELKELLEESP